MVDNAPELILALAMSMSNASPPSRQLDLIVEKVGEVNAGRSELLRNERSAGEPWKRIDL